MTTPGMQGEVSRESMGKTASSAVGEPAQRETGHFRTTGKTAEQNRLQPCTGKPFELANELELDSQKGNPGSYAMQPNHSRGPLSPSESMLT
jgi:hypothetical protein